MSARGNAGSYGSRFIRQKSALKAEARVFCFPFAGGSSALFHGWGELLGPQIEVFAAQPRGRGMRFKETPCQSISEIVADYLDALRQSLDLPYAFYGHSLGGLVAFEIARRLEREGAKLPERLLIGACPPPALGLIHPRIAHLPDEEFLEAIQQRYAGIPEAVLKEPELMELFLPALKADYLAHESFERGQGPELESARKMVVSVPITVFAGVEDGEYLPEHLSRWREHTLAGFEAYTVAGDHFFLAKSAEFVRGKIRGELLGTEGRRI